MSIVPDSLEEALALWAISPSPALARAIHALSARQAHPTPAALRGRGPERLEAWLSLAAQGDPRDLPALLETLLKVPPSHHLARLAALAERADPRLDAWCVETLEALSHLPPLTRKYLRVHLDRLERVSDASLLPRIEALPARLRGGYTGMNVRWACDALDARLPALRERLSALAEAGRERPTEEGTHDRVDPEVLLALIHADPFDDAARLVYADALMERGDPRGEFIALQLRPRRTAEQRKRVAELLAGHGGQWVGPLAPLLEPGFAFERGFLAVCKVKANRTDFIGELTGHPMWSTVRSLTGSLRLAQHPVMRALRELSVEPGDRERRERPWVDLLSETERPLQKLRYRIGWGETDESEHLARCDALPRLEVLTVGCCSPKGPLAILQGPVASRLRALVFEETTLSDALLEAISSAKPPELSLHRHLPFYPSRIRLTRTQGDSGYDTLEASIEGRERCTSELVALVSKLPGVQHVKVRLRKPLTEQIDEQLEPLQKLPLASLTIGKPRER